MNNNRTELVAAWIVAVALVGAMGAQTLLPKAPAQVAPGVITLQPRPFLAERERSDRLSETDLPLVEPLDPGTATLQEPL